jgi:hypothetical protein
MTEGNAGLEELLKSFSPEVQALTRATRALVLEEFAGAHEKINPSWKVISFGTDPKMAEQVCVISPQRSWVNLAFAKGATLPDPEGLLEGTGKGIRHVRVKGEGQLRSPAIRAMVRSAVQAAR